jgi:hypothetical protein
MLELRGKGIKRFFPPGSGNDFGPLMTEGKRDGMPDTPARTRDNRNPVFKLFHWRFLLKINDFLPKPG